MLLSAVTLGASIAALFAWRSPPAGASGEDVRPVAASAEQLVGEASRVDGLLSLVARRQGRPVLEAYFEGRDGERPLHLRSGTKSVTSLLVGIAIDDGLLPSVDATLGELLGARGERFGARKAALTVHQLLTMTAGLDWDESSVDEYNRWRVSPEPVAHYLKRRLVTPPGERWSYSSGASHLLSAILGAVTGGTTLDYAEEVLFEPLGFRGYRWESVTGGETNGAAGLELRPADAVKLGELMLGGGAWGGRRIVSSSWVEASTRPHVRLSDDTSYGYQWWIYQGEPETAWTALGHAGQVIAALPRSELVVVANSRWRGLERPSAEQQDEVLRFLVERVIPFAANR